MKFLSVFVVLLIMGCGSDDKKSGPSYSELTSEQRSEFKEAMLSVTRAIRSGGNTPTTDAQRFMALAMKTQGDLGANTDDPPSFDLRQSEMDQIMARAECEVTQVGDFDDINFDNGFDIGVIPTVSFKVAGAKCPIAMVMDFGMSASQSRSSASMKMEFGMSYEAKHPRLVEINKLQSFSLDYAFFLEAKGDQNSVTMTLQDNSKGSFNFSDKGSLQLNGRGAGSVRLTETSQTMQFKHTSTVRLPDFSAVIEVAAQQKNQGDTTMSVTLNGEAISERELQEVFGDWLDKIESKAKSSF